jgi:nucleotide sugar dehydrogenase
VNDLRLTLVGLGKMGLPAAVYYAREGAVVTGIDVDPDVVDALNDGRSLIGDEPGVAAGLGAAVESGKLRATTDYSDGIAGADIIIVLVPLMAHGGSIDFSTLDAVVASMAPHLPTESLVIFETTLPVGTTRSRFTPHLQAAEPTVSVAYSPERVSSGRVFIDLETYPKIVGGIDEPSTRKAVEFYRRYLPAEVRDVGSAETAEMVKLAETTYRDVNIAYANELARMCDEWGLDVVDIVAGANSQPYSHIHSPGVGVGGHCIPHYPHLLLASTSGSELISEARRVNDRMPRWTLDRAEAEIGSLAGLTVLALGVAYRPGVLEVASSPTFDLARESERLGATLLVDDPLFGESDIANMGLVPWAGETPDVVVLVTAHEEYLSFDLSRYPALLVVDGRNAWERKAVEALGHRYVGIGR